MAIYGYARVSSKDQDCALQIEALKKAGAMVVRSEQASGRKRDTRRELQIIIDFLQPGDLVLVTRLDRLGRSLRDLQNIVQDIRDKGCDLKATEQEFDTSSSMGRAMIGMLGTFAEFEADIREERQREGIEKAKKAGKYKGRSKSIDRDLVAKYLGEGKGATETADLCGCSVMSVYRIRNELPNND